VEAQAASDGKGEAGAVAELVRVRVTPEAQRPDDPSNEPRAAHEPDGATDGDRTWWLRPHPGRRGRRRRGAGASRQGVVAPMIPISAGVRMWLATSNTDMRLSRPARYPDQMPVERRPGYVPVLETAAARTVPVAVVADGTITG